MTTDKLEVGKVYKSKGGTTFKVVRKFADNDVWGMIADNGIVLQISNNSEYEPMTGVDESIFKPKNDAQILKEIKKKKQKLGVEMPSEAPAEAPVAPAVAAPVEQKAEQKPAPVAAPVEKKAAKGVFDAATCTKVFEFLKSKYPCKEKKSSIEFQVGNDKMLMYNESLVLRAEIAIPNATAIKTFQTYSFYNFEDVKAFLGYV